MSWTCGGDQPYIRRRFNSLLFFFYSQCRNHTFISAMFSPVASFLFFSFPPLQIHLRYLRSAVSFPSVAVTERHLQSPDTFPTGGSSSVFSGCLSGCPCVRCQYFAWRDLFSVEGFQWNSPQIFIVWVGIVKKVFDVRGRRSLTGRIHFDCVRRSLLVLWYIHVFCAVISGNNVVNIYETDPIYMTS